MARIEEEDYESVLVAETAVKLFRLGIDISCFLFFIKLILNWKYEYDLSYFWVTLPLWIGPAVITLGVTVLFVLGFLTVIFKELRKEWPKRNSTSTIIRKKSK